MTKTNRTLAFLPAALLLAIACGDDDNDETAGPPAETPGTAFLRVAHLSPDAPAVDLCVAPHGSGAFTGPVLESLGAAAGLAYGEVTAYVELDAGRYDVRIVAPDATACGTSLAGLPDVTDLPALGDGTYATAAAIGLLTGTGDQAFRVTPYVDTPAVDAGKVALRFVHAAPTTPEVDVGLGTGDAFTPVFTGVAFGAFASGTGLDANGFVVTDPIADGTVSARLAEGGAEALVLDGITAPAGTIATAFAIGNAAEKPLQVLLCLDNAAPQGALATCLTLPQ